MKSYYYKKHYNQAKKAIPPGAKIIRVGPSVRENNTVAIVYAIADKKYYKEIPERGVLCQDDQCLKT